VGVDYPPNAPAFSHQSRSLSDGVGVLSKITVPRSRAAVSCLADRAPARCRAHNHVPIAEPSAPASIPRVRLLKGASCAGYFKVGARLGLFEIAGILLQICSTPGACYKYVPRMGFSVATAAAGWSKPGHDGLIAGSALRLHNLRARW
jgi:hypothetical protein